MQVLRLRSNVTFMYSHEAASCLHYSKQAQRSLSHQILPCCAMLCMYVTLFDTMASFSPFNLNCCKSYFDFPSGDVQQEASNITP